MESDEIDILNREVFIEERMSAMQNNWINDAMFYHIYPLGFTGAPRYNEGEKTAGNRILKVFDWIPHLKEL